MRVVVVVAMVVDAGVTSLLFCPEFFCFLVGVVSMM